MKKFLVLMALVLCCVLLFAACEKEEAPTQAPTQAPTEAPTEAPCAHEYDNDCDKYCNICMAIREVKEHVAAVVDAVPATCTSTGLTEGSVCSVCGEVLVAQTVTPVAAHTEEIIPAVAAGCHTNGSSEGKKCSVCGEILEAPALVPATGTVNVEEIPAVAATCTTTGLTAGKKCADCGLVIVAQAETPALGHTVVSIGFAVAPTCTEEGHTAGKKCSVCNEVLEAQVVIPALGHSWKTTAAVEATCTTEGITAGKTCTACGEVDSVATVIPALGHTYSGVCDTTCDRCDYVRATEDAHVYTGVCDTTCGVCGYERVTEVDHTYDSICDADCNVCGTVRDGAEGHKYDGVCDAVCNVCGLSREDVAEHTWSSDCDEYCNGCGLVRETFATHTIAGKSGHCSGCGIKDPNYANVEGILSADEAGEWHDDDWNYIFKSDDVADNFSYDGFMIKGWKNNTWGMLTGCVEDNPLANGHKYTDKPIKISASASHLDLGLFGWVKFGDIAVSEFGVFFDELTSTDEILWNKDCKNYLEFYNGTGILNDQPFSADVIAAYGTNARRFNVQLSQIPQARWNDVKAEPGVHTIYIVAKMQNGVCFVVQGAQIEIITSHTHVYPADGTQGVGKVTDPTCTEQGYTTVECEDGKLYLCPETSRINYVPATGHNFSEEWSYASGKHWHTCLNNCGAKDSEASCSGVDGTNCDTCGNLYGCVHVWSMDKATGVITCINSCKKVITPAMHVAPAGMATAIVAQVPTPIPTTGECASFPAGAAMTQYQYIDDPANPASMQRYLVIKVRADKNTRVGVSYYTPDTSASQFLFADISGNGEWNVLVFDMKVSIPGHCIWGIAPDWQGSGAKVDVASVTTFASKDEADSYAGILRSICEHSFTVNASNKVACSKCGGVIETEAAPSSAAGAAFFAACPNPAGGTVTNKGSYVTLEGCGTQMQWIDPNANRYVVIMFRQGTASYKGGFGVCYYNAATSDSMVAFTPWGDGWTVGVIDMKCTNTSAGCAAPTVFGLAPDNTGTGSADLAYMMTFATQSAAESYAAALRNVTIAE